MTSRRRFLALLGGGAVAVGGVGLGVRALPGEAQESTTPTIHYGEEACAFCGMTIGDARFASAWRAPRAAEQHFDDIGCMINAVLHEAPASPKLWCHDYATERWIDATGAQFVRSSEIKTPMAHGLAACADATSARSLAEARRGRVFDWQALLDDADRTA